MSVPESFAVDEQTPAGRRRNDSLLQEAMRGGWAVPECLRALLVQRQLEIALDGDDRVSTRAFAALVAAEVADRRLRLQEQELEERRRLVDAVVAEVTVTDADAAEGLRRLLEVNVARSA